MDVKIVKQSSAERDIFLNETFYDKEYIGQLIRERYSFLTGRKGTGKSAIAMFLEKNYKKYKLDFSKRISLKSLELDENVTSDSILLFLFTKQIKLMLEQGLFKSKFNKYWKAFLSKNGLESVEDFREYIKVLSARKPTFGVAFASLFKAETVEEFVFKEESIDSHIDNIINSFLKTLVEKKRIIITVDDVTDILDQISDSQVVKTCTDIIRDLLEKISWINSEANITYNLNYQLTVCLRNDIFEFMEGSNINKLRTDTLEIEWTEEDFITMLTKRFPYIVTTGKEDIKELKNAVSKRFPNEIFETRLKSFNTERFSTNFYAYIMAVTFNRPRDYLQFCFSMRNRLSKKGAVEYKNIESAEVEYSDYFRNELQDEFHLITQIIGIDQTSKYLDKLLNILRKKEAFTYRELRTEMEKLDEQKSMKRKEIENFLEKLWFYGILGFQTERGRATFKYYNQHKYLKVPEHSSQDLKYYLHRGIYWAYRLKSL